MRPNRAAHQGIRNRQFISLLRPPLVRTEQQQGHIAKSLRKIMPALPQRNHHLPGWRRITIHRLFQQHHLHALVMRMVCRRMQYHPFTRFKRLGQQARQCLLAHIMRQIVIAGIQQPSQSIRIGQMLAQTAQPLIFAGGQLCHHHGMIQICLMPIILKVTLPQTEHLLIHTGHQMALHHHGLQEG